MNGLPAALTARTAMRRGALGEICFFLRLTRRKRSKKNKTERELNHEQNYTLSLFGLGRIVAHQAHCSHWRRLDKALGEFLARHHGGDWGDLVSTTAKKTPEVLSMGSDPEVTKRGRRKLWVTPRQTVL